MTLFIISMMPSTQALSFFDDEAHSQLRLVRERMSSLEATNKRQADTIERLQTRLDKIGEQVTFLDVCSKQQTGLVNSLQALSQASSSQMDQALQQQIKSMVSLQGAADSQSAELRSVKGLNEDLTNKLQSLDARMHQFEAALLSEVKKKSHDEQLLMKQQGVEGAALRNRSN